ncbi:uncharacterized protein [Amphiura filiformis]|uniref:uncharacterized protein isoform X3 n=1 Tax=Amphiura filiformis TaxID=82378 RepID=UPI003B21CB15
MAAIARSQNRAKRMTYVRDIPLLNRQQLCKILDVPGPGANWKQLAGHLGFSADDLNDFERAMYTAYGSPTDMMLQAWDAQNHTITELFDKLYEIKHARGMMLLEEFVDAAHREKIKKIQGEQPDENNDTTTLPLNYQPHQRRQPVEVNDMSAKLGGGHPSNLPPGAPVIPDMKPPANTNQRPHPATSREDEVSAVSQSSWNGSASPSSQTSASNKVDTVVRQHPHQFNQEEVISNLDGGTQKQINSPVVKASINFAADRKLSDDSNPTDTVQTAATPMSREEEERLQRLTVLRAVMTMKYEDIQKATENFSDSYKLGSGSFGTVYYMVHMNTKYAIKRLHKDEDPNSSLNAARFNGQMKEITALVVYRHTNIVTLYFNCTDGPEPCLGYEYMQNGSLEDNLQCRGAKPPLDWELRNRIAFGAATGLFFLHKAREQPLIHGDIKSANILLDEYFKPKIGDFGLARYGHESGKTTPIKTRKLYGTMPYLPKDFLSSFKLSVKVDVYSFGIVLMEILTGEKAADEKREPKTKWLSHIVLELVDCLKNDKDFERKLVDELCDNICPDWPWDLAWQMLELALDCVEVIPQKRPVMQEVVTRLKEINARIEERNALKRRSLPTQNTEPLQRNLEPEESCYDSNEVLRQDSKVTPSVPQQKTEDLSALDRKYRDMGITNPIRTADQPSGSANLPLQTSNMPLPIPGGSQQYRPPPHMPQDLRSVSHDSNVPGQVPGSTPQQSFPTGTSSTVPSSFMNRPTPPSTVTPPSTNPPMYDSFYDERPTGQVNYRHHDQGQYPSGTQYGDYQRPPVTYDQYEHEQYLQQQYMLQQQQYQQQRYHQQYIQQQQQYQHQPPQHRFQGDHYPQQQLRYPNYQPAPGQYREPLQYERPPRYNHFDPMASIDPAKFAAAPPTPSPDMYTGMHDGQMAKLDRTQLPVDYTHRGPDASRATSVESRNTPSPVDYTHRGYDPSRAASVEYRNTPSPVDYTHRGPDASRAISVESRNTPSPVEYTHRGYDPSRATSVESRNTPSPVDYTHRGHDISRAPSMDCRYAPSPARMSDTNQEDVARHTSSTIQQQQSYVHFPDTMHMSQHSAEFGNSNRVPMQHTDVIPNPGFVPDSTSVQEPFHGVDEANHSLANSKSPVPSEDADIISPLKQLHLDGVTTQSTDTQDIQQPASVNSVDSWDGERKRPVPTQHTDKLTTQELAAPLCEYEPFAATDVDQSQLHSAPPTVGRPNGDELSLSSRVPTQMTEPIG